MKIFLQSTLADSVELVMPDATGWKAHCRISSTEPGIEILEVNMDAPVPQATPEFEITFSIPLDGAQYRWTPNGQIGLPMWHSAFNSRINSWLPLIAYYKADGGNRHDG